MAVFSSRPMRFLRLLLIVLAALYLAAAAYMGVNQRRFLYPAAPAWIAPEGQNIPAALAVSLTMPDGVELRGWRVPAREGAQTYLYFHGNAKGLDDRAGRFRLMTADGSGLVAMSYRGYGGSGGTPSEKALVADARAIYAELTKTVPENRIVLFGESLGTGVVLDLALDVHPRAIILDSPYLSVLARAQDRYPWLPVSWILRDPFRSDLKIGRIDTPILILHGTDDRTIPVLDSAKLAAQGKPERITRKVYPGAPHVVPYDKGPSIDVPAFLRQIAGGA